MSPRAGSLHLDRRVEQLASVSLHPDEIVTTKQLAAWFGVSVGWCSRARRMGLGPPHIIDDDGIVRYRVGNVKEWLRTRTPQYTTAAE